MPIATFRGEKSVGEIADKLFVRLTPRQREKAEAAILKANPKLAEIDKVHEGAVLRVPDIPELRPKTARSLDNPDAQIAARIGGALRDYDRWLAERVERGIADTKEQTAVLKGAELRRALANAPALKELAEQTAKALAERGEEIAMRQKTVATAIRSMVKDLDKGLG